MVSFELFDAMQGFLQGFGQRDNLALINAWKISQSLSSCIFAAHFGSVTSVVDLGIGGLVCFGFILFTRTLLHESMFYFVGKETDQLSMLHHL